MKTLNNFDLTHSLTKCSLCGFELKTLRSSLVVGTDEAETKRERLKAYTALARRMAEHLHKVHQDAIQQIAVKQAEYAGWLMMIQFDSDDAELITQVQAYSEGFRKLLDDHDILSSSTAQ